MTVGSAREASIRTWWILGSATVTDLLLNGLEAHLGATFAVEPNPAKAADLIIKHVEGKRRALGLEAR